MSTLTIPYVPVALTRDNFDAQEASFSVAYPTPDTSVTLCSIPLGLPLLNASKVLLNLEVQFDTATPVTFSLAADKGVGISAESRNFYASPAAAGPVTCVWNVSLVRGVDYDDTNNVVDIKLTYAAGTGNPNLTVVSNGNGANICGSYTASAIP